jgi:hypothetical protein
MPDHCQFFLHEKFNLTTFYWAIPWNLQGI